VSNLGVYIASYLLFDKFKTCIFGTSKPSNSFRRLSAKFNDSRWERVFFRIDLISFWLNFLELIWRCKETYDTSSSSKLGKSNCAPSNLKLNGFKLYNTCVSTSPIDFQQAATFSNSVTSPARCGTNFGNSDCCMKDQVPPAPKNTNTLRIKCAFYWQNFHVHATSKICAAQRNYLIVGQIQLFERLQIHKFINMFQFVVCDV
jgi:hypothetical protein